MEPRVLWSQIFFGIISFATIFTSICYTSGNGYFYEEMGPGIYEGASVIQTSDGNLLFTAEEYRNGTHYQGLLLKLNTSGGIVWAQGVYSNKSVRANFLTELSDSSFVLTSSAWTQVSVGSTKYYDFLITKHNSDGSLIWAKELNGSSTDCNSMILQTSDNGFALAYCNATSSVTVDYRIVKLNSTADVTWTKDISGYGYMNLQTFIRTSDNFLIFGGSLSSNGYTGLAIKMTESGDLVWTNTVKYNSGYLTISSIIETSDKYLMLAGGTNYYSNSFNYGLVKLDANGTLIWSKLFNDTSGVISEIIETSDSGFLIIGGGSMVIKLNQNIDIVWVISFTSNVQSYDVVELDDGSFAIVGGNDFFAARISANGSLERTCELIESSSVALVDITSEITVSNATWITVNSVNLSSYNSDVSMKNVHSVTASEYCQPSPTSSGSFKIFHSYLLLGIFFCLFLFF